MRKGNVVRFETEYGTRETKVLQKSGSYVRVLAPCKYLDGSIHMCEEFVEIEKCTLVK